jgi:hypothetical protein
MIYETKVVHHVYINLFNLSFLISYKGLTVRLTSSLFQATSGFSRCKILVAYLSLYPKFLVKEGSGDHFLLGRKFATIDKLNQ